MRTARQVLQTLSSLTRYSLKTLLFLVGGFSLCAIGVIFLLGPKHGLYTPIDLFIEPIGTLVPLLLGYLINRKYPGHTIAFLFFVMAFISIIFYIVGGLYLLHLEGIWSLPSTATSVLITIGENSWQPALTIPILLIPLFFPTGQLLSPRWRWAVVLYILILGFNLLAITLVPWPSLFVGPSPMLRQVNGAAIFAPFFEAAVGVVGVIFASLFVLVLASVVLRYRYADQTVREQMHWPLWAVLLTIVVTIIRLIFPSLNELDEQFGFLLSRMMALLFPLSLGVAIWRKSLWDINLVISRTAVYGTLTLFILLTYVGVVAGLGALFHTQMDTAGGLLATAIVALLIQPLRNWLQRSVNRLLYGSRDDPAAVLSELTQHIQSVDSPDDILPNLVKTIAHTLKLPYVAINLPNEDGGVGLTVAWGEASERGQAIPLSYHGTEIGQLLVATRDGSEGFDQRDRTLLQSIAALTANTVRAVQLSDALRRSRQRIVTAREEERRRLRRDLHDGLGPQLASQTLGLEAVSQMIEKDPEGAQQLLDSLKQQSHEATTDVRRLVYNLRPPTLDELGLVGALQQSANRLGRNGLHFTFALDEPLPELPAAVETAAYRIVQEAMTNVVRHAQATKALVRLNHAGDQLILSVSDNGVGLSEEPPSGVGLQSIRERAAELNGLFQITSNPNGGTIVEAKLPLVDN